MRTDREFETRARLPQLPGETLVTRLNLPADNDAATAICIERMRRAAVEDSAHPVVWRATREAIATAGGSRESIAAAVWSWIHSHVTLRQDDPALAELLGLEDELDFFIRPARLLTMTQPAEDCDGFSMLCWAMLLAAGVPCEPVTIKADSSQPGRWSHVYGQAILEDGSRFVLDCSHGEYAGWEPPTFFAKRVWPMMKPAGGSRAGLHGYGLGDSPEDFGVGFDGDFGGGSWAPPVPMPTTARPAFDWSGIIGQTFGLARQIALKPGQYVQGPGGVMSSNVPGAVPGQYPGVGLNVGGLSSGTLLLGVVALGVVALAFSGGRR